MPDLADGESTEMKGSGASPYVLKNVGGVYSCSCPAWRNQGVAIERRTCKHLKRLRGEEAEAARVGVSDPSPRAKAPAAGAAAGATTGAPPLLLAERWSAEVDLRGWWMSEKLDGVRAYWDGARFVSRLGNTFHAPAWFVDGLPGVPLDGELWGGRKKFQLTTSIARRQDRSEHWKELAFMVFDAPALDAPFEERLAFCAERLTARAPYARLHEHVACDGPDHLERELRRVEALGGEGLMLRKPGSRYEVGRSWTLLKVKTFHDAEARVVDHLAGEGKHAGRLGALVAELADGTRFSIGTGLSDADRRAPPPIGSLVTFRYQELSDAGVPRFPSFVGVRADASGPSALAAPAKTRAKRPRG